MDQNPANPITILLARANGGDPAVLNDIMTLVYAELKSIARRIVRSASAGSATLCPTALIHEAYLKLVGSEIEWRDRIHFYAVASRAMRLILIDHVRAGSRAKRGGGGLRVTFQEENAAASAPMADAAFLALNEALDRLEERDPRKARAIELLYFGGLTYAEIAAELSIAEATVHADLKFAKAWLSRSLQKKSSAPPK
jgi:RNA polymerase sigma factor (TIGR02999 family)